MYQGPGDMKHSVVGGPRNVTGVKKPKIDAKVAIKIPPPMRSK